MKIRFECHELVKHHQKRKNFYKTYPFPVLKGINLNICENRINAIVGKSGAGKSTLARILMRLDPMDSGNIKYKNQDLGAIPIKEFRIHNQIVFQNPLLSMNPCLKISKILAEPLKISGKNKIYIQKKINDLMDIMEIPASLLTRYPSELSSGQQQRVVLARALSLEPEFIILDESFSSLDQVMAFRLMSHLKKVFHQLNTGILYISHQMDRIRFFSDYVAVLKKGKIVFQGEKDSFFTSQFSCLDKKYL